MTKTILKELKAYMKDTPEDQIIKDIDKASVGSEYSILANDLIKHIEMTKIEEIKQDPYYRLFEFFKEEHNLTLLDSQIQDVIHEIEQHQEVNQVVKENLTTEIEEKAREYES